MFYWYLWLLVLGLIVGSFLNVVALRYNPKKSFFKGGYLKGRSKCPHCKKKLDWIELLPVVSFVWQSGKCRKCGEQISWRYPLVEILTGVVTVAVPYTLEKLFFIKQLFLSGEPITWFVGLVILWTLFFYLLIVLSLIDWQIKIIPNEINLMLMVLSLVICGWQWWYGAWGLSEGTFVGGFASMFGWRSGIWINHLTAAVLVLSIFAIIAALSGGRGMGMGDVKLVGVLGLAFGWPDVGMIIVIAFILGAIVGVGLIIKNRKNLKSQVPFGPFLAIAGGIVFFWGETVLRVYFSLFGII